MDLLPFETRVFRNNAFVVTSSNKQLMDDLLEKRVTDAELKSVLAGMCWRGLGGIISELN